LVPETPRAQVAERIKVLDAVASELWLLLQFGWNYTGVLVDKLEQLLVFRGAPAELPRQVGG